MEADDHAHRCGHDRGRVSGDPACSPRNPHDPPGGGPPAMRATVLPGGTLQWGSDVKFTFKMTQDRRSLEGAREEAGHIARVTMQKLERE